MISTADQINIFNMRYTNITAVSTRYAQTSQGISSAMSKPRRTQYKTVNQLLKECPLVGSSKLGLNFIA